MRIDVKAFGLACGIVWGSGLFLIPMWLMLFGAEGLPIQVLGEVYIGYSFSIAGAFIGAIWGFVDGFIGGAILAWLYNTFAKAKPAEG